MQEHMLSKATRKFLGWIRPILHQAEQQLFESFALGVDWDMRDLLVLLPSSLAKRRLQELLALRAAREKRILYPPHLATVGELPEHLYVAKFPFASDFVQILAWCEALRRTSSTELRGVLPLPGDSADNSEQRLELGKLLSSVHRELASECLDFPAVAKALGSHPEAQRWKTLAAIQRRYLDVLDGLNLWDIQTARLVAIQKKEPRTDKRVVLIGAVDLNRMQRSCLEQIASQVEVWIGAPDDCAELFDEFGCLNSDAWGKRHIDLPAEVIRVGNTPMDQSELAVACLAELGNRYHCRDITLGVPDSSLIPILKQQVSVAGVIARNGPGTALSQAEPAKLLQHIGSFLASRSYHCFSTLIRHPAVDSVLQRYVPLAEREVPTGAEHIATALGDIPLGKRDVLNAERDVPIDWLSQLDEYYHSAIPSTVDAWINDSSTSGRLQKLVVNALACWLAELKEETHPISYWVSPLIDVMAAAYPTELCDLDDPIQQSLYIACQEVCSRIVELSDIPTELQLPMRASDAIQWLIRSMSGMLVSEPANPSAVEMLGWLELSLDDTPALILTGMHDGVVPESVNSDLFLPNQLRGQLGMFDNARRYARDMYALEVMRHSREHLRIVVGKTKLDGSPLVPSRLLLACELEALPGRILHLISDSGVDIPSEVASRWCPAVGGSQIDIPKPDARHAKNTISVTAFRTYLECPYRYYLRHVLRLRSEGDVEGELDGAGFGNLLHDTLRHLHGSPVASSCDGQAISAFLRETLYGLARDRFGPRPPVAVEIQLEQACERLDAFAIKQAERAAEGWRIEYVEYDITPEDGIAIGKPGKSLLLHGRIDRIDHHPATGQWAIWDYKSGETAANPISNHILGNRGWIDLQLPLYRFLVRRLANVDSEPTLGYITLPKEADKCDFKIAEFTLEQLAEADRVAAGVIENVLAGKFWPPTNSPPQYDDYARICQTNVQRDSSPKPIRRAKPIAAEQVFPRPKRSAVIEAQKILAACDLPVAGPLVLEPQLIRASAGTGKTFQLSNRLLQLILAGQSIDQILATTFTRKAAGEILHRVLQRLAAACVMPDKLAALKKHVTGVTVTAASCLVGLRRVVDALHRLRISTLDSFFSQIAVSFGLEMDLPAGWSMVDPSMESALRLQAIQRLLDHGDRQSLVTLVKMLSKGESQRRVTEEIAQTVESGYHHFRATDRQAWGDLKIPTAPSEQAINSVIETLRTTDLKHATIRKELDKLACLVEAGYWEDVLKHGLLATLADSTPTYYKRELTDSLCAALRILQERCAAELLPPRRAQAQASYRLLEAFNAQYNFLLRRYRLLAFSDITYFLAQWINPLDATESQTAFAPSTSPDLDRLYFRLDAVVKHLLLDEFQDTAPEQWRIIETLARPLGGKARPGKSFFCVGDTKQAIYGWRGGVSAIFDVVAQSVSDLKEVALNCSFRSSQAVIDVVNEVFANFHRHEKFGSSARVARAWSSTFPKHETALKELPGYVLLKNLPKAESDVSSDDRKYAELEYGAGLIAELAHAAPQHSIGVLFRKNESVATMIDLLRAKGVSASQDGGNPLTDSCAVELVLSLLHLADHPGDSASAFHVAHSPLAGKLPVDSLTQPDRLSAWLRRQISRLGLGQTVSRLADDFHSQLSWWDQHRMTQLIHLAYQFEPQMQGRVRDFEEFVVNQRVSLPSESQVKVMTIHSSKGLEFDAVFLPDLEIDLVGKLSSGQLVVRSDAPCAPASGVLRYMNDSLQRLLPDSWQAAFQRSRDERVSETLCMLYVAMTRARSALVMLTKPRGKEAKQDCGSILQSMLDSAGKCTESEAVLYEQGDRMWYAIESRKSAEQRSPVLEGVHDKPLPMKVRTDAESAPRRSFRVAAPSSVGKSSKVPLAHAFSISESIGATVGTLIHAFFEQIAWLDDYRFDPRQLREVALREVNPDELRHVSLDNQIESFGKLIKTESVIRALSRSRYVGSMQGDVNLSVQVENERPISLILDDRLISGTIDRLVILSRDGRPFAAEILDYKTDVLDPKLSLRAWTNQRVEHHRPQLEIYAQVVSKMFDLPPDCIGCYLILLSGNQLAQTTIAHPMPA